jgi:hypothetical protein
LTLTQQFGHQQQARVVLNSNLRSGTPGNIDYRATSTGDHIFFTGETTERMRIVDTGGVCVGTTTPTSTETRLTIIGGSTVNNPLVQITQNNNWSGNPALNISSPAVGGAYATISGLRLNGLDTGNTIFQDNVNANIGISLNPSSTTANIISTIFGSGNILFNRGATELVRIAGGGNVGIGTNNPSGKIDVRGRILGEGLSIVDTNSYGNNQFQLLVNPPTASAYRQFIKELDLVKIYFYNLKTILEMFLLVQPIQQTN